MKNVLIEGKPGEPGSSPAIKAEHLTNSPNKSIKTFNCLQNIRARVYALLHSKRVNYNLLHSFLSMHTEFQGLLKPDTNRLPTPALPIWNLPQGFLLPPLQNAQPWLEAPLLSWDPLSTPFQHPQTTTKILAHAGRHGNAITDDKLCLTNSLDGFSPAQTCREIRWRDEGPHDIGENITVGRHYFIILCMAKSPLLLV